MVGLRELVITQAGCLLFCAHTGVSMNPTLDQLDLLELERYNGIKPRLGDVILFVPPDGDKAVVHRVIQVSDAGLHTRGDNNPSADPWRLKPSEAIGRVVAAQRGASRRVIAGGRIGLVTAWLLSNRKNLKEYASRTFYPVYDWLARSGIIQMLIPSSGKPKIVAFRVGEDLQLRLFWKGRIVGSYKNQTGNWRINPPYRILIKSRNLPK
jgi:hypothetical protein